MPLLLQHIEGRLIVDGIPPGHNVLVATGPGGSIPEDRILLLKKVSEGRLEIELPEGQFVFGMSYFAVAGKVCYDS